MTTMKAEMTGYKIKWKNRGRMRTPKPDEVQDDTGTQRKRKLGSMMARDMGDFVAKRRLENARAKKGYI